MHRLPVESSSDSAGYDNEVPEARRDGGNAPRCLGARWELRRFGPR
jgi:hypothetical protein